MRRALVLTDEQARHPFRASLPPSVLRRRETHDVERRVPWRHALTFEAQDIRHFVMCYCACFLGVTAFII